MSINQYLRYQAGLTLNKLYPAKTGVCACGCNTPLGGRKKKWASDECRDASYIQFAIVKGDTTIIRECLFQIDGGACRMCGVIADNWEADHIIPVSHGGGACGITNFQTLCQDCHREKTYNLSHHKAISWHASSILLNRNFTPVGQCSRLSLNTSKEMQSHGSAVSPSSTINSFV